MIGKTRYGNFITILWNMRESKTEIVSISEFTNQDESFDVVCALSALWIRERRKKKITALERSERLYEGIYDHETRLGPSATEKQGRHLGLRTSIDRLNYGRTLLSIEYHD